MKHALILLSVVLLAPGPVASEVSLKFQRPSRVMTTEAEEFSNYKLPVGPFADGAVETLIAEGALVRKVWRIGLGGDGTLQVMDGLRRQIEAGGFELLFECETEGCGGFDFRFNTEIVPEPAMHVDLGDFRFLAAQRLGGAIPEYLSVLVSRSGDRGYVQMIHVGGGDAPDPPTPTVQAAAVTGDRVIAVLERTGRVPLDDLVFPSGSASLGEGSFETLQALAAYLRENPERKVVLVGHTDAVGSLDINIGLSRTRAQSVMERLTDTLDVPQAQLTADGIGYLAPRTPNETDEGRARNRRVEAVLLPAE